MPQNTLKNTGCGKGEAFCEHPFALHLQQREKDKQMSTLPRGVAGECSSFARSSHTDDNTSSLPIEEAAASNT